MFFLFLSGGLENQLIRIEMNENNLKK